MVVVTIPISVMVLVLADRPFLGKKPVLLPLEDPVYSEDLREKSRTAINCESIY
jgi:hypothetical protein